MRSLDALPNNLTLQLTSFIGRERELTQITQRLAQYRLVPLTGTGGCGKTRLALQVAAEVLDGFPDCVWLVELAPLADPALVANVVASALGFREQPGQTIVETLMQTLHAKRLLLFPDNCEHLLEASARLAEALLQRCQGVRILATSREVLGVVCEMSERVPSPEVP